MEMSMFLKLKLKNYWFY